MIQVCPIPGFLLQILKTGDRLQDHQSYSIGRGHKRMKGIRLQPQRTTFLPAPRYCLWHQKWQTYHHHPRIWWRPPQISIQKKRGESELLCDWIIGLSMKLWSSRYGTCSDLKRTLSCDLATWQHVERKLEFHLRSPEVHTDHTKEKCLIACSSKTW